MSELYIPEKIALIKVGSSSIGHDRLEVGLDSEKMHKIGQEIGRISREGYGVILVTSGAIMAGAEIEGLDQTPDVSSPEGIAQAQALASSGTLPLLNAWQRHLPGLRARYNLLTSEGLLGDDEYAKNALPTILRNSYMGGIAVVNQNDSASPEEIKKSDNDILSANVSASLVNLGFCMPEDLRYVMCTGYDGIFADPIRRTGILDTVRYEEIKDRLSLADNDISSNGRGGIKSKLLAAEIVGTHGIAMNLVDAQRPNSIYDAIMYGIGGTRFEPLQTV